MEPIHFWVRAPQSAGPYTIIPQEVAKEALERCGHQTEMRDGELWYEIVIDEKNPMFQRWLKQAREVLAAESPALDFAGMRPEEVFDRLLGTAPSVVSMEVRPDAKT